MALRLFLFFAAGLVRDGLTVLYYRSVSRGSAWWASGLAGIITLYDIFILSSVFGAGADWAGLAAAYALGTMAGTRLAMSVKEPRHGEHG